MKTIKNIYINGSFVHPIGMDTFDIISPVNQELLGRVALGNEIDTQKAIKAAKDAFNTFSWTTKEQRIIYLEKMHTALTARKQDLIDAMVMEYGGTLSFSTFLINSSLDIITALVEMLKDYTFERSVGNTKIKLTPLGVVGVITPWNASTLYLTNKIATGIAAGCTFVVKPSEMSALQTQIFAEAIDAAGFPPGVINFVNGLGNVVGAEISRNRDIAKITFTGSTRVGKGLIREGAENLKRLTLELGGKSPNVILEDADLSKAIPFALSLVFLNSGQACIAGTRLLVPKQKLDEVKMILMEAMKEIKVGDPSDPATVVGPAVSQAQFDRVQEYIQIGIEEGAELLVGGLGKPEGLEKGNYTKPTIFVNVKNNMRIAREEIFGPVLSVITYKDQEEAIAIANDTDYGLAAYIQASDPENAQNVADRLNAGQVTINGFKYDPYAPFGGFKQSGWGRENGTFGLEAYLEPKAILF